jgi:non-ribosomal peptide synthetase component F
LTPSYKGKNQRNTPSRFKLLLATGNYDLILKSLKILMIGGEEFPQSIQERLKEYSNIQVYNMYGPTETTVWSTVKEINENEDITIGKPISNTQIYVLGKGNKLMPIGATGELCIGGEGVTRGYLNKNELT